MGFVHVRNKGRKDPRDSCTSSQRELGGLLLFVTMDESVLETDKQMVRCSRLGRLKSSPFYEVLWEHRGVFPTEVLNHLPADRGIRHEIDVEPGTKYCVTRQWPLPKEQVDYIDQFFDETVKEGHVRESKSPHCSPTFCARKATGGWHVVQATIS